MLSRTKRLPRMILFCLDKLKESFFLVVGLDLFFLFAINLPFVGAKLQI